MYIYILYYMYTHTQRIKFGARLWGLWAAFLRCFPGCQGRQGTLGATLSLAQCRSAVAFSVGASVDGDFYFFVPEVVDIHDIMLSCYMSWISITLQNWLISITELVDIHYIGLYNLYHIISCYIPIVSLNSALCFAHWIPSGGPFRGALQGRGWTQRWVFDAGSPIDNAQYDVSSNKIVGLW